MYASVQKECLEAKKAKWVAQSKNGKKNCTGRAGIKGCISRVVTPQ